MRPERPDTDAADSNCQVVKNFSPLPGLTLVSGHPKLRSAIVGLHRKHDLPYLQCTGLNLAGSQEWTSINVGDRPHTLLLVIVLSEEDRKRWVDVDAEARQILRDHGLEEACWLRYYLTAAPEPREFMRIRNRPRTPLDRESVQERIRNWRPLGQTARTVSPPPSLPELEFGPIPQLAPAPPRPGVRRVGGWRQGESAGDDVAQTARERNDSAQEVVHTAPTGRELYELARDAQLRVQQDSAREHGRPYPPPPPPPPPQAPSQPIIQQDLARVQPRPSQPPVQPPTRPSWPAFRRPPPQQNRNPWQLSTEEILQLHPRDSTNRQSRLRSPFRPLPSLQVSIPQPNDNQPSTPPSPAEVPQAQPNDDERPTYDPDPAHREQRTAEVLRLLNLGESEEEYPYGRRF